MHFDGETSHVPKQLGDFKRNSTQLRGLNCHERPKLFAWFLTCTITIGRTCTAVHDNPRGTCAQREAHHMKAPTKLKSENRRDLSSKVQVARILRSTQMGLRVDMNTMKDVPWCCSMNSRAAGYLIEHVRRLCSKVRMTVQISALWIHSTSRFHQKNAGCS